jgi:hypothetical protein
MKELLSVAVMVERKVGSKADWMVGKKAERKVAMKVVQ